jgi:pyruvate kinase
MWGVISSASLELRDYEQTVEQARDAAARSGLVANADYVVIVTGFPFATAGSTNNLRVAQIGL